MNSQSPNRWFNPIRFQWRKLGRGYRRLMSDVSESSTYLRDAGLKPTIRRLLGDCSSEAVLDVGAGGAWIFKDLEFRRAAAVDLAPAANYPPEVEYIAGDAAKSLPYADGEFDTVVSNLMLCYCADLSTPLQEMARVTRKGGRLIVSTVHPHFYRTGKADAGGAFTIENNLSRSRPMSIMIGNRVGPFRYFYHPYTSYLNAMIEAGWTLRHAEDWFYDEADYKSHFPQGDSLKRSPLVPIFTFFSCLKEG